MLIDTRNTENATSSAMKPFALPTSVRATILKPTVLGRVLVLATNTSDAWLGCGGMLARLRESRTSAEIAIISTHKRLRLSHTLDSAQILGISEEHVHIVDFGERELPSSNDEDFINLVENVGERIRKSDAMTVFVPWHADPEADRRALNHAAFAARKAALPKFRVLEYPLWTDARADENYITKHTTSDECWMLDVRTVMSNKQRALVASGSEVKLAEAGGATEYFFEHIA
jgi:LmbE family N-acetylglucosaminyl deacetylase